jgi:sigma-B regulation protein RsbU (phosphoserine phosphatase)
MSLESWDSDAYGHILNSLPDGIYVTDMERHILFWNTAAERITGWAAEDIVGKSCYDDVLSHEDQNGNPMCGEDSCPLHRAIVHAEPSTLPVLVFAQTKSGSRIPVEVSVAPVYNDSGKVIGGIESFRDLTPLVKDLERARIIQMHAMDVKIPDDPRVSFSVHNVPMEMVSGDFYHIEQITADAYAVMIADVTGHGVAAGLYTMQLRSLWEDSRELLLSPSEFVAHMNEKLFELTREDDSFATGFYGVLNVPERRFRYVVAGHPSPFLLHNDEITPIKAGAAAIGLLPWGEFETQEIVLQPGDRVLLYSDGAVEARTPEGDELGEEGLSALVQQHGGSVTHATLRDLAEAILNYSRHASFNDDVTLLGITLSPS